jgi:hypothetical protein
MFKIEGDKSYENTEINYGGHGRNAGHDLGASYVWSGQPRRGG